MKKTNNYDIIERFLEFDLNEKELAAFEERLENEEAFVDEVRKVESSKNIVTEMFDKDIAEEKNRLRKEILGNIRSSDKASPVVQMPNPKWKYLLAVAATIAMLVATFIFWPSPSPDYKAIADNFYKKTNHVSYTGTRSNNEVQTDLEKAFLQFGQKTYKDALVTLESVPASFSEYEDVLLLEGRCYFEMNKTDSALEKFEAALQFPDGNKKDLASWYIALSALRKGDLEIVQEKLHFIIEGDFPLKKKARRLQQEL